ncbi:MAG: HEAT repeat domain-containing protein, partial [Myxococcota bacterium]
PAALLGAALDDPGRPLALRAAILSLEPDVLRPSRSRVVLLADRPGPLELDALDALARLDGSLSPERVRGLLAREDASARALAVTRAGAALDLAALSALARRDPDPSVRAAAVAALARRDETEALAAAGAGLFDSDGSVRASAAQGLGSRGAESVALLEELALQHTAPEAGGPIAALSLTGPAGHESLARLAASHPDPKARALAGLALGRPLPEDH